MPFTAHDARKELQFQQTPFVTINFTLKIFARFQVVHRDPPYLPALQDFQRMHISGWIIGSVDVPFLCDGRASCLRFIWTERAEIYSSVWSNDSSYYGDYWTGTMQYIFGIEQLGNVVLFSQ